MHKVTSEIYTENNHISERLDSGSKFVWRIFRFSTDKQHLMRILTLPQLVSDAVTKFTFKCPSYMIEAESTTGTVNYDSDDDLDVKRNKEGVILIGIGINYRVFLYKYIQWIVFTEHSVSTELSLVGLQVWRAALLLADYIMSHSDSFRNQVILELGSGVGLTSIVASYLVKEVICTGNANT